jgi:DNA-binding PadR family transcriptional regulator
MTKHPDPETLLPLTPAVFHILLALTDGQKHGYAIMQEVATMTEGKVEMGPGTLYGTIKRMLSAGLIEEIPAPPDDPDPRRRYYRLTGFGDRVVRAEVERLNLLVMAARQRQLLPGGNP